MILIISNRISVFNKLIWHTVPKSFLFPTVQLFRWASGAVNYDYIITNSIKSLLIGSICISCGAHTNHCWANLAHASKHIKNSDQDILTKSGFHTVGKDIRELKHFLWEHTQPSPNKCRSHDQLPNKKSCIKPCYHNNPVKRTFEKKFNSGQSVRSYCLSVCLFPKLNYEHIHIHVHRWKLK